MASVIGGALINAFKPLVQALNEAMSHIIAFAETVSNALGKIFGWKFEKGGGAGGIGGLVEDTEDLESGLGGAEKAAKKLNKQLRAFDELNLITTNTDGAGDTGGGAGSVGGGAEGQGGQWLKTESIFEGYESELDTLYKLGQYIGNALTNAMNSIDWDAVYEKARNFGKGLADFLNGLISPDLFGALGRTIAGALNTAVYAAISFGETFDWKDFGLSIATGINNFFATFDFESLAQTINVWAKGILDSVITAINNTDWEMIGEQIGTFLTEIDFLEIGKKIGIMLWSAINGGIKLFKGMFNKAPIETTILGTVLSIGLFASAIGTISGIIARLSLFLKPLLTLFSGIGSLLSKTIIPFVTGLSAPVLAVVAAISSLIIGIGYVFATNEEVRESFSQSIAAIRDGLQPALDFISNTLLPDLNNGWERLMEILSPLGEFLNNMFVSIWQDMVNPALTYIGETVLPKVAEAFGNLWNNVLVPLGLFLGDVLEPIIQIISEALTILWENVVVPLADAVGNILSKRFEGLCNIYNETVIPIVNAVIDVFQFLWKNVFFPIVDYLWNNFKPVFENVFKAIGGIVEGIGQVFEGLIEFITGVFTGNWEKAWEGVKNIFKGIFNQVASIAEGVINAIIGMLNFFLGKFNGVVTSLGNVIGIDISIPEIPEVHLPKLATGGIVYKPTYAEIGEAGKEGILPLTNREAMSQMVDEIMISASGGSLRGGNYGQDYSQTNSILMSQNQLLQQQNKLLQQLVEKEFGITKNDIGKAARDYSKEYFYRTGKSAYVF